MANASAPRQMLQFAPFSSAADPSFWHSLAHNKLHDQKLNDDLVDITGSFKLGSRADLPARMSVGAESFGSDNKSVNSSHLLVSKGELFNANTIDAFHAHDVPAAIDSLAKKIWNSIQSGEALKDPSLLARFSLMTFSDLKKYHFYYWFGFPALALDGIVATPPKPLSSLLNEADTQQLFMSYGALRDGEDSTASHHAFFIIREANGQVCIKPLGKFKTIDSSSLVALGFSDPCALQENPGWPLRNILITISYHFAEVELDLPVIAMRKTPDKSICFNVSVPNMNEDVRKANAPPKIIKGLEKDKKQRLRPRICNLSASMDPLKLASTAVGLNLSLMRWRLMPEINLPHVAATKCLLLGAGTLGCNVGRLLLGWGVKKITFCDNGNVSYSNPVRQTLFTFEDSAAAKPKAECAAARLKEIFPGVDATGIKLSIPMPGHPVSGDSQEQAKNAAAQLEKLIDEHDATFLLMDTRESRWLPTMLCAKKNKMCFTAAVGFDSYVAMRHGGIMEDGCRNVGCYFCNDVVAPTNSTVDRTLDQQCTVSRPGVSMIVSANVTELLASMLHHPKGILAPAQSDGPKESCLGMVPHQIRGFLADFAQMSIAGQAFDKCTACSPKIISEYSERGFDFIADALNKPKFLEDLSGLTAMHKSVDDLDDIDLDWDDDEDLSE